MPKSQNPPLPSFSENDAPAGVRMPLHLVQLADGTVMIVYHEQVTTWPVRKVTRMVDEVIEALRRDIAEVQWRDARGEPVWAVETGRRPWQEEEAAYKSKDR